MAIQEYDEAIRLERNYGDAYYKRGLAYEALGKTKEAERDFEKAIQVFNEEESHGQLWSYGYYERGLAYEALGKTIEAEGDFAKAKELGYYSWDCPVTILDAFTRALEVAPLVLEGEISIEASCQKWSFNGDEGQILRFEPRAKTGNHIDFGHVAIHLSLVDNERLQTADPEVIGWDEELREIALPEAGTYTLQVEGNIDESSGAYVIVISEPHPS